MSAPQDRVPDRVHIWAPGGGHRIIEPPHKISHTIRSLLDPRNGMARRIRVIHEDDTDFWFINTDAHQKTVTLVCWRWG